MWLCRGDEGTGPVAAAFKSNSTSNSKAVSPRAARLLATYFSQAPEKYAKALLTGGRGLRCGLMGRWLGILLWRWLEIFLSVRRVPLWLTGDDEIPSQRHNKIPNHRP